MKTNRLLSIILVALVTLGFAQNHPTRERELFFYHRLKYGSDGLIHPIRLILNGGYGILQMDNRGNSIVEIEYANGFDNVWWNLTNPIQSIEEVGWNNFIQTQIIPISFDSKEAYYWPNYTLHTIGGGMSFRMMDEWFYTHRFPYPKIHALATLMAYHLLNESVESNDFVGYDPDPIADVLIFNPLGVLLFWHDGVSRFFSHTLNMADWSYQVSYDPFKQSIENVGQNFVMKFWLTKSERLGLFYHFGTHGELGLSFKKNDGQCFSFGAGLVANKLENLSNRADLRELTAALVLTAGVFYDRNNSLLASLIYSYTQDFKLRMNVYPGLVKIKNFSPGFYWSLNQRNQLSLGITVRFLPIGLSASL
jgi:hypothetical protein